MTRSRTADSQAQSEDNIHNKGSVTSLRAKVSRGRTRRSQRHIPLLAAFVGILLMALIIAFFGFTKIASLTKTIGLLEIALNESEAKLAATTHELTSVQTQLEAAVQGRFPQLRRIEFDKVLPIQEGHVKHILFTLLKTPNEHRYEYKILLQNDTDLKSHPAISLLMFDQLGVQLGTATIPVETPLLKGESRSYSSIMEMAVPKEPIYFFIAED